MENVVSARRLRKSVLKDTKSNINFGNIGVSDIEIKKKIREHDKEKLLEGEDIEEKATKFKFKQKFFIKMFISINIVFLCLICNLMLKEQVLNNKYSKYIIDEYNKDYTKEGTLEKIEEYSKQGYEMAKYIIPEEVANYISMNYVEHIKPRMVDFSLKDEALKVFNNTNEKKDEMVVEQITQNQNENNGIGGGEPYEEAKLEEVISAVSIMDIDVNEILSKKIDIKKPVEGTVTSRYGAREQIFDNVNPYHTGIDIANKMDTKITSATDGIVTKTEELNKYYGNNVEIEKDGVIFKYAHLNKINVKNGDNIKQGDIIGLMGSTGMSTGSHLHFEIKVNDRSVDPEKVLEFK